MNNVVSIVVPVYNAEKTLDRCVQSIVSQSYEFLDIILVDDGSVDNSGKICDEWANKDDRIRVFHKNNGGVSSARNFGIENASGDFITFVDSDDYILGEYILILIQPFEDENVDVTVCEVYTENVKGNVCQRRNFRGEIKTKYQYIHSCFLSPYNKLYRTRIIFENDIRFPINISYAEDRMFNFEYLQFLNQFVYISRALYQYTVLDNPYSLSKNLLPSAVDGIIEVLCLEKRVMCDIDNGMILYKHDLEKFMFKAVNIDYSDYGLYVEKVNMLTELYRPFKTDNFCSEMTLKQKITLMCLKHDVYLPMYLYAWLRNRKRKLSAWIFR